MCIIHIMVVYIRIIIIDIFLLLHLLLYISIIITNIRIIDIHITTIIIGNKKACLVCSKHALNIFNGEIQYMTNGYGIPTNKYEELSQLFYGYEEYLYNQREEYLQEYIETKTLIDNIEEQDSCIRNFIKGWLLSLKCLKKHQIFSDSIQLLITDDCQLKCLHCYNQNFERTHKHLSLDEVKDMITKFDSIGEYIDIRTGKRRFALCGGEPTLNPNLLEICDYLNEKGHTISLLTNGIYLSDEYIQRFKTYKDFMVQVSIDGMRNIHDSIRGTGTFDKSVETIERLNKNGIKLVISFTANSMNYKEFPKVFDLFSKYENVYNIWCDRCVCESNFGINPLVKKDTITFIK